MYIKLRKVFVHTSLNHPVHVFFENNALLKSNLYALSLLRASKEKSRAIGKGQE